MSRFQYPKANIKVIMGKIRDKLRPTYKDFVAENMPKDGQSTIPYDTLRYTLVLSFFYTFLGKKLPKNVSVRREKLIGILGDDFTEHEMITISRAFPGDVFDKIKYNREQIRAITLTELKKGLWDDVTRLREYFWMRDPERRGLLPKDVCYVVLRACRLPLQKELVEKILEV